jgi:toxin ParE1/3/4
MAHAILWLPAAADDLEDISDYIGQRSPAYADAMIERILDAVDGLADFPTKGHPVADVRIAGVRLREVSVRPYRIIYRLRDERVVILAAIHGARLLRKALKGRRLG